MLELIISFSLFYWISYFLWIYSQISSNSSNVVFSIKIPKNLQKIFVNNEKLKTYNWTRLLIFNEMINFYFLNLNYLVTCRIFFDIFCRCYLIIKKRICPQHCILGLTTLLSRSVTLKKWTNCLLLIKN